MNEPFENQPNQSDESMEQRLWEYIDNTTAGIYDAEMEKLIAENAAWKSKYHELLELNQLIQATELEQPSMRFTKNVMEEISKYHIAPATKRYINHHIIYGIAAFFITVIASFIVYGISQVDWSIASDSTSSLGIDFSRVDYSRMFNNTFVNMFMMLNIVLGLLLLDRYLNGRRKKWMA